MAVMGAYCQVLRRNIDTLFAEGSHEDLYHLLWVFALRMGEKLDIGFRNHHSPIQNVFLGSRDSRLEIERIID